MRIWLVVMVMGVVIGFGGLLKKTNHNSVTSQGLHYFSRPGGKIPQQPILNSNALWKASDLQHKPHLWTYNISFEEQAEIIKVVRAVILRTPVLLQEQERTKEKKGEGEGKEEVDTSVFGVVSPLDFEYVLVRSAVEKWREEVKNGKGFILVKGVPIQKMTKMESHLFFWSVGLIMGIPGAQNGNDDLLGHIRDTHDYSHVENVREYRTPVHIGFHCDAADVVGLLCLSRPESGGRSLIASSVTVFNEMLKIAPKNEFKALFEPVLLDTRGDGGVNYISVTPMRYSEDRLRTFYHSTYMRTAYKYKQAPSLPPSVEKALELYDSVLEREDIPLSMLFEEGDMQFISNHEILHSRASYKDTPEKKRHLLRLWISFDYSFTFSEHVSILFEKVKLLGNVIHSRFFS